MSDDQQRELMEGDGNCDPSAAREERKFKRRISSALKDIANSQRTLVGIPAFPWLYPLLTYPR
jgi:hypothetical protein